ncbi:MAG: hypothetical protein R2847_11240 [Bacteroidia bacterium]
MQRSEYCHSQAILLEIFMQVDFASVDGVSAERIAKWNGSARVL